MKKLLLPCVLGIGLAATAAVVHIADKGAAHLFSHKIDSKGELVVGKPLQATSKAPVKAPMRAAETQSIPWTIDFAKEDLKDFTIIDANEDDITWNHHDGYAFARYSSKDQMDDWMITPPLNMIGGHAYTLTFKACTNNGYEERFEVMFGDDNTVEAMTNTIISARTINESDYIEITGTIVPRMSGKVYIGFHGMSDPNKYELRISEIAVTNGADGDVPAGVRDLTISSDDPYSLNASIKFYAPETTMAGKPLDQIDNITVSRDGKLITTFNNPTPGAELSYEDTAENGGEFTYSVCATNKAGAGYTMTCKHIIGGVTPLCPDNVVLRETTPGTMHLTWDPVTKDVDGNTIPDGFVHYMVLDTSMEVINQDITDTECTFSLATDQQTFVQVIVAAYTMGGISEGTMSNLIAAGPAMTSFSESFSNGSISNIMAIGYEFGYVDYVSWDVADDNTFLAEEDMENVTSSDGDNGFAYMYCELQETGASMFTGKIALPAEGPSVSFDIYNQSWDTFPDQNTLELMVSEDNGFTWDTVENTTVYELCGLERGWHHIVMGLHDYAGKTVQLRWQVTTMSYPLFLIDAIKVETLPAYDLKAEKFTLPAKVSAGEEIKADLTVLNIGAKDVDNYSVRLYVDNKLAKEMPCTKIAGGKRALLEIPYTISPVAENDVEIRAEVVYGDDSNTDNNISPTITVTPAQARHPHITDLEGTADENGMVSLKWSKPLAQIYTPGSSEGFEDGEDFAHEFGNWIFVDRDGMGIAQLYPSTIPGVTAGETKASFMVFNADAPTFNSGMAANSGKKYLASVVIYEAGNTNDDWAITPALNGASQVITFNARSLESYYPETMELYYSFGSTNPDDFVLITTIKDVPGVWTEYNIPVPNGARRFAVRNHSHDAMALLLDDFIFADENAPIGVEIEKFNIYCDEECVGSVNPDVTTFTHQSPKGHHLYAVTAVYKELGESKSSNKVAIQNGESGLGNIAAGTDVNISSANGTIVIGGLNNQAYNVVTPAGASIASGTATGTVTIEATPGIYIVAAGATTAKVIVK